jgi:hypothetical protein
MFILPPNCIVPSATLLTMSPVFPSFLYLISILLSLQMKIVIAIANSPQVTSDNSGYHGLRSGVGRQSLDLKHFSGALSEMASASSVPINKVRIDQGRQVNRSIHFKRMKSPIGRAQSMSFSRDRATTE